MPIFQAIRSDNDIKEMILSAFDLDLDISGAWGYSQDQATVINTFEGELIQEEHRLASLRSYIEMNMTLSAEERYASISLKELSRTQKNSGTTLYEVIAYEVTAMQEKVYNAFITEYKKSYGKKEFDISKHFEERKEATLSREINYWFEIKQTQ